MTRRITCYVVFVTLIWGAHTGKEETRPDMFKSNMTRNDFSNLLSSLIKLNEQRVNVLQKLNHLEDYGVLSEVLRSGDKKTRNGNPSNLYLIVMSKNPTDSSRRNSGYQLVDSVTSLEVAGSNNIPKLDYVLDPASFVFQNGRKENTSPKSIFANTPRVYKQEKTYLIGGDRIIKITTTKKPLQYRTAKQKKKHLINLLMTPKDTFQATESRWIEIVNKSSNASQRLLYSSTVASINDQSTRYNRKELTKNKNKLTTKPITIKYILRRKRKKPKYNLEDTVEKDEYHSGSLFNISFKSNDKFKNTTQINGDMFTKLFLDNNLKPETDKIILKVQKKKTKVSADSDFADDSDYYSDSKVTDISVEKIDDNNHHKSGTDKVISKVTEISVKKIDDNIHHKSGTDKVIPKVTDISVKKIDNNHRKPGTNKIIKATDISVKNIDNNHRKPGTDKVISKVTDISVKNIDNNHRKPRTDKVIKLTNISVKNIDNNHRKPRTDKVISKVTDISVKNIDYNNRPKLETNQNTLKAKVHGNQHTKLIRNKSNLFKLDDKTSRFDRERRTTVLKNLDQIINGTVGGDNASDHTVFNISPIPNPNLNINNDNAYADDFMATKETDHENGVFLITTDTTLSVAASNILAPLRFPTTAKNTPNRNNLDFLYNPNNSKDNSNNDKMKTANDLHNGDNHNDVKLKKVKDYDNEENNNNGERSIEVFTLVVTDEGKGRVERMKVMPDLQLAPNGFDQSETKPIARKPFQNCFSKKARKLCYKSCKSAYRNVCLRMSCTSRSKRALKKECKRSCEKTFKYSKYSDESRSTSDGSGSESW